MRMKRLIVMRHAEAQPEQLQMNDRERSLSSRGMQELEVIRRKLQGHTQGLKLVLCSNVKRTRQTLEGIKGILPSACETTFEDDLYHVLALGLVNRIRDLEDGQDYVMVIAHNPGVSDFLNLVVASNHPSSEIPKSFPTSGVAIFEGNFEKWNDAAPARFRVQSFLNPDG